MGQTLGRGRIPRGQSRIAAALAAHKEGSREPPQTKVASLLAQIEMAEAAREEARVKLDKLTSEVDELVFRLVATTGYDQHYQLGVAGPIYLPVMREVPYSKSLKLAKREPHQKRKSLLVVQP